MISFRLQLCSDDCMANVCMLLGVISFGVTSDHAFGSTKKEISRECRQDHISVQHCLSSIS